VYDLKKEAEVKGTSTRVAFTSVVEPSWFLTAICIAPCGYFEFEAPSRFGPNRQLYKYELNDIVTQIRH